MLYLMVFQSTPLQEGRPFPAVEMRWQTVFQSTPLQEGRPPKARTSMQDETVSIHAPAGGATMSPIWPYRSCTVSIHAPAGGATWERQLQGLWFNVSIHAPAGGATPYNLVITLRRSFNPRPCRRGDNPALDVIRRGDVSIHAPAGGATLVAADGSLVLTVSIHAPAGGAT